MHAPRSLTLTIALWPAPIWTAAILAAVMLPLLGCGGGKKKQALSVPQMLERARGQKTPELQSRELVRVARSQFRKGDRTGASKTLSEAYGLIPKEGDAMVVAPRALEVAALFGEMGEQTTARGVVAEVVALAGTVSDPVGKTLLLAEAGGLFGTGPTGAGDAAKAKATLAEAAALVDTVEPRFKAKALAAVALGYVEARLLTDAKAMVETLEASARSVEDPRSRAEALAAAAKVRGQSGDADAAKTLLEESATAADAIESSENKAYALLAVAKATSAAGDKQGALKLLGKAEKAAQKMADPDSQKSVLEKINAAKK